MGEFSQWFAQQPFSTKWITVFSLLIPLLMKFHIISPYWLVWSSELIFRRLQLWRIFTAPFLTAVNFNFIISLYFRFQYSFYLETGYFSGRSADYLYFLMFSTGLLSLMNCLVGMASLWESFSMAIVYVWAMNNRQVIVNFMFGIKFAALYLPLVLGLMQFLFSADLFGPLLGILTGHTYYFLTEIYDSSSSTTNAAGAARSSGRGKRRLMAPAWLKNLVPVYQTSSGSYQGFSVQRPEQAFGGRANATGTAPTPSVKEKDEFKVFAGKGQKLGS